MTKADHARQSRRASGAALAAAAGGIAAPLLIIAASCATPSPAAKQPAALSGQYPHPQQPAFPSFITSADTAAQPPSVARFRLSQNYPAALPPLSPDEQRLLRLPYRQAGQQAPYMKAVLGYCFHAFFQQYATDEDRFRVERSPSIQNQWFHAPFLHIRPSGPGHEREAFHGTTFERPVPLNDITPVSATIPPNHVPVLNNYAVGFYNPRGGFTVGQVWRGGNGQPPFLPTDLHFPVGTVGFKLLFTTATPTEVPYLDGAPVWHVNGLSTSPPLPGDPPPTMPPYRRQFRAVRLLQVDIAVKMPGTSAGEPPRWVFGTFQYDRNSRLYAAADGQPSSSPWQRLTPVSLMWGLGSPNPNNIRDPRTGFPANNETWINPDAPFVKYRSRVGRMLGVAGRANGPVDNPASSCLDCHGGQARFPPAPKPDPARPLPDVPHHSLDYSLQLEKGMENDAVLRQPTRENRLKLLYRFQAINKDQNGF